MHFWWKLITIRIIVRKGPNGVQVGISDFEDTDSYHLTEDNLNFNYEFGKSPSSTLKLGKLLNNFDDKTEDNKLLNLQNKIVQLERGLQETNLNFSKFWKYILDTLENYSKGPAQVESDILIPPEIKSKNTFSKFKKPWDRLKKNLKSQSPQLKNRTKSKKLTQQIKSLKKLRTVSQNSFESDSYSKPLKYIKKTRQK